MGNNFAIDIHRQPGSSFKPIFDYGPAIEDLKWSTGHLIVDKPTTYSNGQSIQNWDHQYHGLLTIRTALQESYNIPALLTLQSAGLGNAQSFAEKLGITFPQNQVYESYAIGSNAVNPLEMAGAYSASGNGGVYNKPTFVQKVVYPDGEVVSFEPKPIQAMHDYTAYMITDMMRSVVHSGTGITANVPWLDVAGKTGTTNFDDKTIVRFGYPSNATNDSWFVGYTPQYTMAVWTGYAENGPGNYLYGYETKISQLIFKDMLENFGTDTSRFQQPNDVYRANNELYIEGARTDQPLSVQRNNYFGIGVGKQKKYNPNQVGPNPAGTGPGTPQPGGPNPAGTGPGTPLPGGPNPAGTGPGTPQPGGFTPGGTGPGAPQSGGLTPGRPGPGASLRGGPKFKHG